MKKFAITPLLFACLMALSLVGQSTEPTFKNYTNDVGVEYLLSPQFSYGSSNELVTIRVKNYGSSAQSNIPVSYSVDGGAPIPGIIRGSLEPDSIFDYTFPGYVYVGSGNQNYTIDVCTLLEDDENPANDCRSDIVYFYGRYYSDCSTSTEDEYIANVLFGNINNSSGWQGNVADYTHLWTILQADSSETITVTNGNAWASDYVYVWVDWNKDYEFYNYPFPSNEEYQLTNVNGLGEIFTGDISVPNGQAAGSYRMRIRMTYNTPPQPCGTATYGEVEDYTIIVEAATAPKIQIAPSALSLALESGQSSTEQLSITNTGDFTLGFETSVINSDEELTSTCSQILINGNDDTSSSPLIDRDQLRYDNGVVGGTFGVPGGGTYQVAAYFPAETMAQYTGAQLLKVCFYLDTLLYHCKLKVYGQGTPTEPGTLIYEKLHNQNATGWQSVYITSNVTLSGEDLWIGYEVTHPAGVSPCGYDEGPAVAGYGNMMYVNGKWTSSADFGLDKNWILYAYIYVEPPPPVNDIGVKKVSASASLQNPFEYYLTVKIQNYASASQSNFAVSYTIDGGDEIIETIADTIASGATIDYTFTEPLVIDEVAKTVAFKACTLLESDENAGNDCKTIYVESHFPDYCDAITVIEDEYIANVSIGEINNFSGWQDSVADYSNLYASIQSGDSEEIIVATENPYPNDIVYIWVDWNKDFEFSDAEQIQLNNTGGAEDTFMGSVVVPDDQPAGSYRMRVRMAWSLPPVPCGGSTYGEAEDYTIKVINSASLSWLTVNPASGTLAGNETSSIDVTFNSTGLLDGIYNASLVFGSNDPLNPFTSIPLTLMVGCPLPAPINLTVIEDPPGIAFLEWALPEMTDDLIGFNIYRDGVQINSSITNEMFYNDSTVQFQSYAYNVGAVYDECEAASDTVYFLITDVNATTYPDINIYPNPASEFIYIKSGTTVRQLIIKNSLGLTIYRNNFEGKDVRINLSALQKGMYYLIIETSAGCSTRKLLVQ